MAIIRKGDKDAEKALREKAASERNFGPGITPEAQRVRSKKRREASTLKIDTATGNATTLSPHYNRKEYKGGGISGSAIAYANMKKTTVKSSPHMFTGVIEGGKLIKGGSGALERTLRFSSKRQNFAQGHDGAKE